MGGRSYRRLLNNLKHAIDVFEHVVIPEAQDAIALAFEASVRAHRAADLAPCWLPSTSMTIRAASARNQRCNVQIGPGGENAVSVASIDARRCHQSIPLRIGRRRAHRASRDRDMARRSSDREAPKSAHHLTSGRWRASHTAPLTPPHKGEGNTLSSRPFLAKQTTPPLRRRSRATPRRRLSRARARAECSSAAR